jgi:hypothetical protein
MYGRLSNSTKNSVVKNYSPLRCDAVLTGDLLLACPGKLLSPYPKQSKLYDVTNDCNIKKHHCDNNYGPRVDSVSNRNEY